MKKFLSIGLCLCLVLTFFAGCGKDVPSDRYDLTAFTLGGESYNKDDLDKLGQGTEIYIEFSDDQKGLLVFNGESMDFTWDGQYLISEGDSIPYRLEEGKLIVSYEDVELIFTKG